jgi:hypothetical protein
VIDLMTAVVNRWNNAGLDDSIAALYVAGEGRGANQNKTGTPAGNDLPRAEYTIADPPPTSKTRGGRYITSQITFHVWGTDSLATVGYTKAIRDAFLNSDAAATNPLVMANGQILEVDCGAAIPVMPVDEKVYFGQQVVLIRHRVLNAVPA